MTELWPLAGAVVIWIVLWGAPIGPGARRVLAFAVWIGALWLAHDAIDRWFFARFDVDLGREAEVVDGHELRLRSPGFLFVKRTYRLAGARPPAAPEARERARAELSARLRAGKVRIELVEVDPRDAKLWHVRLLRGGRSLADELVAGGWLVAADAAEPERSAAAEPPTPAVADASGPESASVGFEPLAEPAADERPWWERDRPRARWIAWIGLGLLGAVGFGLLRNAVSFGGGLLLAAIAAALYDLWHAYRIGEALAPPSVALGLVALLGGYLAVRLRPLVEELRREAGSAS